MWLTQATAAEMTSTKTWQAQNEIWQAAKAERRNGAYQLFQDTPAIKSCFGNPKMDNAEIEAALKYNEGIELKSIDELIKMDIARYGDNAFLMYEWSRIAGCWRAMQSNDDFKINIATFRRNPYVNAPFNLAWTMAGVAVQFLYDHRWFDCVFKQMMNERIAVLSSHERPSDLVAIDKIRHPFPPIKKQEVALNE